MKMGASVFTIGYPQASLMGIYPKLALGNITALTGFRDDPRTYQISTALQSGNSGGPLLNLHGEAVSMTTSGLGLRFTALTGDLPQNVNYAIKVPYLNVLLNAVVGHDTIPELSSNEGTIEDLTERIKDSILLVIAEPVKRQPEETQVLGKPPESNLELARRGASFGLAGVAEIPDQELETLSKRFKVSKAAIRSLRWGPLIVSQVHPLSGGLWYELEYTSHSYTTKQIIHAAKTGEILERFYTQYSIDRTNSR